MQKHPKQAFGIFEDGHTIKLAHVIKENEQFYLEALDRVELDRPIYRETEEKVNLEAEADNWDQGTSEEGLKIDEFETIGGPSLQMLPQDNLLSAHQLRKGVIALNINDENIHRSTEQLSKSVSIKRYARDSISAVNYRAGQWQYSYAKIGGRKDLWLHQGINLLLEMVRDYQRKSRLPLYYQLADANDIALTDYFKQLVSGIEKRMLLVYLGEDYRKAFVFENGNWSDTLPLQITQKKPDIEVIASKLSLALDSSGHEYPEAIVICGDLVSQEGLDYLRGQFENTELSFLGYPYFIVNDAKPELLDQAYLSRFAIPIALAFKALHPDDVFFTPSNFLPANIIEGQKVFKIAWHGFLVLALVFFFTIFFTLRLLQANKKVVDAKKQDRELTQTLAIRRTEAKEIQEIRSKLELHQKSIEAMRTVLDKKNPWSYLLDIINRRMAANPTSWLTNLRMEKDKLILSGATTSRANVIQFADMLPNSEIKKVTASKIRQYTIWLFEISSDLPEVDWMSKIEEDLERLMALKESYGEAIASGSGTHKDTITGLASIPDNLLLNPPDKLLAGKDAAIPSYKAFIASTKTTNIWTYREMGQGFLQKNTNSPLAPYVRWRTAYRMYLDKEYDFALKFVQPLLSVEDDKHGHAVLLAARIFYAKKDPRYKEYYAIMKNDYARHPLAPLVQEDLKIVGK